MEQILIDVRSASEYNAGHKDGAINLPAEDVLQGRLGVLADIPKNAKIQCYCLSGSRAEFVKEVLSSKGYNNVENIGGFR